MCFLLKMKIDFSSHVYRVREFPLFEWTMINPSVSMNSMPASTKPTAKNNTATLLLGTLGGLLAIALFSWWIYSARSKTEKAPTWDQRDAEIRVLDAQLKSLTSQIKTQQGSGNCSSDSECKIAGLGVKACGGYNDWLIYSTADTQEEDLLISVRDFNKAFERFLSLSLKVPPCGAQPKQIHCQKKHCEPI